MKIDLGVNLGFATNKYFEPETWTRVVSEEIGLSKVQFVADILNPSLPEEYIDSQVKRIVGSCERYGVTIESMFTSTFTRVNHFFHPDREAREYWFEWFVKFAAIGQRFGAKSIGSHFGIYSFDAYEKRREELLEGAVKIWQRFSRRASDLGYEYLIFEPMSIPRELANTVAETKKLMDMVNADSAIPMKVCLDVGHAPDPSERDPYPWIESLGADSPIIHLQQTVLNKSNHWPFIKEYNDQGIIEPKKVLESLRKSGAEGSLLLFEISHREHSDTDGRILRDLRESADYWKEAIRGEHESCRSSRD